MPMRGPAPKPQRRRRNVSPVDWNEVPDVAYVGGPRLPRERPDGRSWPAATRRWWRVVSSMPHCVRWADSDWAFALDTACVHAAFADGDLRLGGELRHRGQVLGMTLDARRGLRIRYVPPGADEDDGGEVGVGVRSIAEYRAMLDDAPVPPGASSS